MNTNKRYKQHIQPTKRSRYQKDITRILGICKKPKTKKKRTTQKKRRTKRKYVSQQRNVENERNNSKNHRQWR
jgi:hypothetical protein